MRTTQTNDKRCTISAPIPAWMKDYFDNDWRPDVSTYARNRYSIFFYGINSTDPELREIVASGAQRIIKGIEDEISMFRGERKKTFRMSLPHAEFTEWTSFAHATGTTVQKMLQAALSQEYFAYIAFDCQQEQSKEAVPA